MKLGAEIAITHHEKGDGTGYPNGIQGAAIPIAERITAPVDDLACVSQTRPSWTVE